MMRIDYHKNCAGHKHPFQWPKKEGISDTIPVRLTLLFICPHESSYDAVVHNIIHQVKRIKNGQRKMILTYICSARQEHIDQRTVADTLNTRFLPSKWLKVRQFQNESTNKNFRISTLGSEGRNLDNFMTGQIHIFLLWKVFGRPTMKQVSCGNLICNTPTRPRGRLNTKFFWLNFCKLSSPFIGCYIPLLT